MPKGLAMLDISRRLLVEVGGGWVIIVEPRSPEGPPNENAEAPVEVVMRMDSIMVVESPAITARALIIEASPRNMGFSANLRDRFSL